MSDTAIQNTAVPASRAVPTLQALAARCLTVGTSPGCVVMLDAGRDTRFLWRGPLAALGDWVREGLGGGRTVVMAMVRGWCARGGARRHSPLWLDAFMALTHRAGLHGNGKMSPPALVWRIRQVVDRDPQERERLASVCCVVAARDDFLAALLDSGALRVFGALSPHPSEWATLRELRGGTVAELLRRPSRDCCRAQGPVL